MNTENTHQPQMRIYIQVSLSSNFNKPVSLFIQGCGKDETLLSSQNFFFQDPKFFRLSCQRHSSHPPQRWFKIDKDKNILIDYLKFTKTKTLTLIIYDGCANDDNNDNNKRFFYGLTTSLVHHISKYIIRQRLESFSNAGGRHLWPERCHLWLAPC